MVWMAGGYARYAVAKEFVPEIASKSSITKPAAARRRQSRHPAPWACPRQL